MTYKPLSPKWLFILVLVTISHRPMAQAPSMDWVAKVGAKSFPASKKIFSVNGYGAVSDTTTVNTKAIQKAIDACAAQGGGVVTFKPGVYVSGSIFIKSNVVLQIDKGVLLLGSQNFDD